MKRFNLPFNKYEKWSESVPADAVKHTFLLKEQIPSGYTLGKRRR